MYTTIVNIIPGGVASKTIITPGDVLRTINGNAITDVLDYQYYSYDSRLLLELTGTDSNIKLVRVSKPEGADLGLEFKSFLMDRQRSCRNKCIFCFIDQLPKGMRETLYYKDDDVRLSFLEGNYVTLTNLKDDDIRRIIKMRISPINVSVHTLDTELRQYMLGKNSEEQCDRINDYIKEMAHAGIKLNCQIVCCPGVNDKDNLQKTMEDLEKSGRNINSVSIVPVGLTKHREGLCKIQAFDKQMAQYTIKQVEDFGEKCYKKYGRAMFYCADELYMTAGRKLPPDSYYDDYPQLENGVGMMRLFIKQFKKAMEEFITQSRKQTNIVCRKNTPVTVITGTLAAPYLEHLIRRAKRKYHKMITQSHLKVNSRLFPDYDICAIKNNYFGESITVSGLITGEDIISQLEGRKTGKKVLIPQNMLRRGDAAFLDDLTVNDVSDRIGVPIQVVAQDGGEFFRALTGSLEE